MAKSLIRALVLDIQPSLTDVGMVRPELHLRDITSGVNFKMIANNYLDLNNKYIGLNSVLAIKNERRFANIIEVENKNIPRIIPSPTLCPCCSKPLQHLKKIYCCENINCLNIRKGVMHRLFKYLRLNHVFDVKLVDAYMDENPDFDYMTLLDSRDSFVYNFNNMKLQKLPDYVNITKTFQDNCVIGINSMDLLLILPIGVSQVYAEKISDFGKISFSTIKKYDISDILCSGVASMTAYYIINGIGNETSKSIISKIDELKCYVKGKL